MKAITGIGLFVIVGFLTAYLIGFQPNLKEQLPYDEEQRGLKDQITIKFSHVVAENTPKGLAASYFSKLVTEMSNDRIEIQVYPNGMLYTENTEVAALRRGDIQMMAPSFSTMSAINKSWLAMDLPFAFDNQDEVEQALNGELGKKLFQTLDPYGLKGVAFWFNGFKQLTSSTNPLLTLSDFKNVKFRIQPSPVIERQFKMLGASTAVLPFNEVYHNLAVGNVSGQENTISNIVSKKLYQVQHYMTLSNHGYLGYAVVFNRNYWNNLPSDVQEILTEALRRTTEWTNQQAVKHEEKLNRLQKDDSLQINILSDEVRRQWKEQSKVLYEEFMPKIGKELMQYIPGP
ncbi:DctP family TRAP transporter solute-binding subunit [Paenibacillus sp. N1-5-1-14]|uniref:DctP family TRAP transporter solute-binding subunit n=1 Tax=Paenibacillus radicibacter TaxID=2972488 RepID=UPI002158ED54|nr:DctP family TRAP transporter solute-binding subunit [Paenibacillus radicibacter]MCR8643541.1 DctP family TRAP transporter solute-binding subunit [Paenibacillus radicibacter]